MNTQTISLAAKDHYTIQAKLSSPEVKPIAAIFILPDYAQSNNSCIPSAEALCQQGILTYSLKSRGYGAANEKIKDNDIVNLMIEDLEAIMASCRSTHIDIPFILLGSGLGGHIALYYLLKRKVSEVNLSILTQPWLTYKKETKNFLSSFSKEDINISGLSIDYLPTKLQRALEKSFDLVAKEIKKNSFKFSCIVLKSNDLNTDLFQDHDSVKVSDHDFLTDSLVKKSILLGLS